MAEIIFTCPQCKGPLKVDESGAGMTVDCPHCVKQIKIPIVPPPLPLAAPVTANTTAQQYVKTSRLAIASLLLTTVGLATALPGPIAAIICGHMARSRIKRSGGVLKGGGLALTGLILGYICAVGIVASVAIPMGQKFVNRNHPSTGNWQIRIPSETETKEFGIPVIAKYMDLDGRNENRFLAMLALISKKSLSMAEVDSDFSELVPIKFNFDFDEYTITGAKENYVFVKCSYRSGGSFLLSFRLLVENGAFVIEPSEISRDGTFSRTICAWWTKSDRSR